MPDLDALLYGEKTTDMSEVAAALKEGPEEHWQVELIRRYLITPEQRTILFDAGTCEHDLLNGRTGTFDTRPIFADWNAQLGEDVFG